MSHVSLSLPPSVSLSLPMSLSLCRSRSPHPCHSLSPSLCLSFPLSLLWLTSPFLPLCHSPLSSSFSFTRVSLNRHLISYL